MTAASPAFPKVYAAVGVGIHARARIISDWMPLLDARVEEEAAKVVVGVVAE